MRSLLVLLLILGTAAPLTAENTLRSDSLAANYFVNNDYIPDGFPADPVSRDFAVPVAPEELIVVYPSEAAGSAEAWGRRFHDHLGVEIPFLDVEEVCDSHLESRHLILLGSISDNPLIENLYKRRYAFSDAYFPGEGGFIIHPSRSIWNRDRQVLVLGSSRTEDLDSTVDAFLSAVERNTDSIGAVRRLETDLDFPEPPESVQPILDRTLENAYTTMAPYGTIANWGLSYHLTGERRWAEHFRDAFHMMYDRAGMTDRWISESWTNVYFNLWKLMMVWELIDDDPAFTEEDRRIVEEVLWGFTTFVRWLPNLDPDQAPPGEMRQNHTTFLALSLYFSHRYYSNKYDLDGLEPMMEKVHRAFEEGQANSFVPNDDAGGYLKYGALHTLTYLMAEDDSRYIDEGHLRRATDLLVAVFDNRGQQVTFGDVGGYSFRDENSVRDPELMFFAKSAYHYDSPDFKWLYDWIGLDDRKRFSLPNLYHGEYVRPLERSYPEQYTGVQAVPLDRATRQWFGRRAWRNDRHARADHQYFHKLAMRQNFEAEDEYLLLGGMSALSHGHHDGNTILRLTWKDRIWLFDLDYIKFNMKYHNGVTVVRDGIQEDPPPLTRLDFTADGKAFGLSRSKSENYSGADWGRTIVWRKGEWFLVLDDLFAVEGGDFRFLSRWRTRGDEVDLDGNRLRALQGGKSFRIFSADDATRHLEFEEDGFRNNWSRYPWGEDGLDILVARKEMNLNRGESYRFANLMTASDSSDDPGYRLLKAGVNRYLVQGPEASQVIGTDPADLEKLGLKTDADLYILEQERVHLVNVNRLGGDWGRLTVGSGTRHLVIDRRSGGITDFSGNRIAGSDRELVRALRPLPDLMQTARSSAYRVQPGTARQRVEPFGIETAGRTDFSRSITARHWCDRIGLVTGDETGRIRVLRDGRVVRSIRTPTGEPVTSIASGDVSGNGRTELVAGDREGNLYAFEPDGQILWHHELRPFYGNDLTVTDITIGSLDESGEPTVLAANSGWNVTAVNVDGEIRWESFTFYHKLTRVDMLETGEGGDRYVVAGNTYHSPVNVIDPETGVVNYYTWEEMGSEFIATTDYFGIHLTEMTFLDASGDGLKDIVFGTLSHEVHAIRAEDGERIWSVNVGGEVTVLEQFETLSGSTRLLAGTDTGDLILLSDSGERLAGVELGRAVTGLQMLPVVEGPGGRRQDLAVSTAGGDVVVLDEELLIWGAHRFEEPLEDLFLEGVEEGVYSLSAVGEKSLFRLGYQPFVLRPSWHY